MIRNKFKINQLNIIVLFILFFTFGSKVVMAQNSDELLKAALKETNVNHNYNAAIKLSKQGLAISPNYTDFRVLLARLYMLTDKNNEAIKELEIVLKKKPKYIDALGYMINAQLINKNYTNALTYANQYLGYYPDDKKILIKKLSIIYLKKDYTLGEREINAALTKYPNDDELKASFAYLILGVASNYYKNGDWVKAEKEYKSVLAIDQKNAIALQTLFNLSLKINKPEAALHYAELIKKYKLDPDIDLKRANLLKTINRFDEAEEIARNLKNQKPNEPEVAALYKNILFAQAKYLLENADTINAMGSYRKVIQAYPADTLIRNQLINLQLLQKSYNDAIMTIDTALVYYHNQQAIQLKKLSIMQMSATETDTYNFAKVLNNSYPENEGISSIYNDLWEKTHQNRVGMSYANTSFNQTGREPWNVYSFFYTSHQKFGSLTGRLNYADRFYAKGYQFELEAYTVHTKGYSYIDFAYSNALVFPKFKAAYSYFLPLKHNDEIEIGSRYTNNSSDIFSFAAAYGKFFNRYYLNLKTYLTPIHGKVANAYLLNQRYYLTGLREDYVTFIAGYGFSPDNRAVNFEINDRLNLQSISFTAGYQQAFFQRHIGGIFATLNNQEYAPGKKRNELEISLSYQYKF
ncbi:MAG: YaiO family outer membrane beta-barrel protein [Bacteroidetes bacterium]|nr:YaiO family outer membrane beta-barrel protein [Bacteroidota bacterium]MBU1372728.1 YaiO family outer membrane beta-barrel protein [Bacteroidota bacterium]MBU1484924.1 YaiO family outer membrane beta-barrel protein [Bacteroidota bacterium]MBU2267086.1 YaiO family outer membrane beta-barrel protein [Bacteroidota bacterium]MBU2374923.1 YaiO family outer membrane beta-barrel protein [Bacteroidota bacterium]